MYRPLSLAILLTLSTVPTWAAGNDADAIHQRCVRYLDEPASFTRQMASSRMAAPAAYGAQATVSKQVAEQSVAAQVQSAAAPRVMVEERTPQNTERYGHHNANPVYRASENPLSTFSIDVDTGSYANVRRFIQKQDRLPPADAVRLEEIINYFDYHYPQPSGGQAFAVHTETTTSPWREGAQVLRIGIQAKDIAAAQLPPANLVFLVDVSGSMMSADKLPMVKYTLCTLAHQTRAQDRVSIISYASGEKTVLPPTAGHLKNKILAALDDLRAGGSTAGEQAIQAAYRLARENHIPNGINRILLATDGDFNVGITDFETLKNLAAEQRRSGVSLTTLGFGTGNYNEHLMEQLADAGDGNYSYIDSPEEARKVLNRQLSSTLATVARDVKIQVEFNPATVSEYRLIGYENRVLEHSDFTNDQADAGDIGAGHSVTALYEIIPVGQTGWLPPLRYQAAANASGGHNEYAHIKIRHIPINANRSVESSHTVSAQVVPLAQASRNTRLALAAATYGERLRGGRYLGQANWQTARDLAQTARQDDPHGLVRGFIALIDQAEKLGGDAPHPNTINDPQQPTQ